MLGLKIEGTTVVDGRSRRFLRRRGRDDRVVHTANIECLAQDLPVVIEAVDAPEHVEPLLRRIDAIMTGGVVMTERAHVVRYGSRP
jgi:PII-like signaling protein